MRRSSLTLFILITQLFFTAIPLSESSEKRVLWVEVTEFVSPALAEHVSSAVNEAAGYSAVVLALDTFGGAGDSMFKIIDSIQSSTVPVIGYVYPAGRQALSAGTYILLATDYAAMAPHTTIGSSQPIVGQAPTNETKFINALVEKIKTYARIHSRNETQAARFVTHNDNLSPEGALKRNVIETIAATPQELLEKAHGSNVKTLHGEKRLDTSGARLIRLDKSLRVQLLRVITDPVVNTILMGVGFLAVILGLTSPGWGAEVAGLVLILLGLIGSGFNVNLSALLLMIIGAALLMYEVYSHALGIAAVGGTIVLGIGMALMITRPPSPLFVSSEYVTLMIRTMGIALLGLGGFFGFMVYKAALAIRLRRTMEAVPRGEGRAVDDLSPDKTGFVVVGGEYWRARSKVPISAGTRIRMVGLDGKILLVEAVASTP